MKKVTNIIVFVFFISLITPTLKSLFEDNKIIELVCDMDETEKKTDNSEEKEIEKNEVELFDKFLITSKINFKTLIPSEISIDFHFLEKHNSQFQEVFSPPPELS